MHAGLSIKIRRLEICRFGVGSRRIFRLVAVAKAAVEVMKRVVRREDFRFGTFQTVRPVRRNADRARHWMMI